MNHKLSEDEKDDVHDPDGNKYEVITGYTNGAVRYVCTSCGKETTNVDETDFIE